MTCYISDEILRLIQEKTGGEICPSPYTDKNILVLHDDGQRKVVVSFDDEKDMVHHDDYLYRGPGSPNGSSRHYSLDIYLECYKEIYGRHSPG